MNAKEFEALSQRSKELATKAFTMKDAMRDFQWALNDVSSRLDRHRLEMEAAEHKPVAVQSEMDSSCRTCGNTLQFYDGAICLKCQEKARQAQKATPAHGSTAELDTVSQEQHAALIRRTQAIEKRLGEIEAMVMEHGIGQVHP